MQAKRRGKQKSRDTACRDWLSYGPGFRCKHTRARRRVMNRRSRREFLEDVGRGMLVASLGSAAAIELGVAPCVAEEVGQRLTFGRLEPLVSLMQETPPE